jgi:hypothetical protein
VAETAKKNKLDLNVPTLAAGAGATVTMSVLGSYLGPLGTLTGAAATSVVSAVVTAVYKHSATVAQEKAKDAALRRLVRERRGKGAPTPEETAIIEKVTDEAVEASSARQRWSGGRLALIGAAVAVGLFGGVAAAEAGVEALAGKPVSAIVQGKPGHGTTLGGGGTGPATTPSPTVEPSTSPGATSGSTVTSGPVVTPSAPRTSVPPTTLLPVPPVLPSSAPSTQTSTAPPRGGAEPSSGSGQ